MKFHNHQRVRIVNGQRTVRIPKEYSLDTDTVFMYWDGFAVVVVPVNGRFVEDERETARWAIEHGYDIPRPEEPS